MLSAAGQARKHLLEGQASCILAALPKWVQKKDFNDSMTGKGADVACSLSWVLMPAGTPCIQPPICKALEGLATGGDAPQQWDWLYKKQRVCHRFHWPQASCCKLRSAKRCSLCLLPRQAVWAISDQAGGLRRATWHYESRKYYQSTAESHGAWLCMWQWC